MVANIVLLMLLTWLACTAAMTIRSAVQDTQATGAFKRQHVTGAPAPAQSLASVSRDHAD